MAVAHSRILLEGVGGAGVVHADAGDVESVLGDREAEALLDFSKPVGVMMVALLHLVPDADEPAGLIARYRTAIAPGSHLASATRPPTASATSGCDGRPPSPERRRNPPRTSPDRPGDAQLRRQS